MKISCDLNLATILLMFQNFCETAKLEPVT